MSPRRRVGLLVALVAAAAVAVVAVAVVSSDGESATPTTEGAGLRPGRPPLSLALGFRDDPEARDLVRADTLYEQGKTRQAAALFAKHDSLEAKVGAALASWPEGSLDRLEQLGKLYPEEAVVQLHLGLARLWANEGDPLAAWRAAAEAEPDTPYAIESRSSAAPAPVSAVSRKARRRSAIPSRAGMPPRPGSSQTRFDSASPNCPSRKNDSRGVVAIQFGFPRPAFRNAWVAAAPPA